MAISTKERSRTMRAFNAYRARLEWAHAHPPIWDQGRVWYENGRERLARAAEGTTLSTFRLAGVTAILSPLTPWERNVSAGENLAQMYEARASHADLLAEARRGTVYNHNARKAVRYLAGDDTVAPSGPKTEPFHKNLAGDLTPVTIDSHMRDVVDTFGLASLTGNARRSMARAVRMCATLHGIANAKAQAIIWTVQRDNLGPAR